MAEKIKLINVSKKYKLGSNSFTALENISLEVDRGNIVVILGPSGSGKTTLLNLMSGLDTVNSGNIFYDTKDITKLIDKKLTKFRKEKSGFIFQTYNLLEHLTVRENVLIGKKLSKNPLDIDQILNVVGLKRHENKNIYQLSGGEQQRVSIARALAKNPEVMFCDEPTGALDEKTGKKVLDSLIEANEKFKTTFVIVTHNPGIALIGDRIIRMNSGHVISDEQNKRISPSDIPWG